MTRLRFAAVLAFAFLVAPCAPASSATSGQPTPVSVTVDRTEISVPLGRTFVFRSTIRNDRPVGSSGLIAHLNVVSLRNDVYVDPEDWSSSRTRYLSLLPPGGSTTLTWRVHAVNGGVLGLYVAVLPAGGVGSSPSTSEVIRLSVAEKHTLNAGGILPLVIGIPALIGLLTLGVGISRRQHSTR